MILSPSTRSPLADLLRVVAVWLAVILLVQGFQGALALGAGPLHAHAADGGGLAVQAHSHGGLERHHHVVGDRSVQWAEPADDGTPDATAQALTLAMALMAFAARRCIVVHMQHLLRDARSWFCCSVIVAPLRRPPRLG
jgi:hypothetical protein